LVEHVLDYGVNHFDVAPTYGDAERKLGPKLRQHRENIFLGCKTQERSYDGAKRELRRSLNRLGIDTIDLYQIHGLEYAEELETITGADGALRAVREARADGLVDHIGLTSHGAPSLITDAIRRIDDLETIMFPLNPVVMASDEEQHDYESVLELATENDIGTLAIKAFAKGPWPPTDELPEGDRPFDNWYRPVHRPDEIQERFDFVASQELTSVVSAGDPKLVSMILHAAEQYEEMGESAQRAVIEESRDVESPVPVQLHD
jgi:aryl-alcohol dehydrogenase-like predicted oxidoreductase